MTVGDLKRLLEKVDDNVKVYVSVGNSGMWDHSTSMEPLTMDLIELPYNGVGDLDLGDCGR